MGRELRRRWVAVVRAVLIGLAVIVGVFVGGMVLVNVALWTGAVERLVDGEHRNSTVHLEIGHAWMLWPSRVHVRDLELEVDAYRYQLHLELPRGEVELELTELLSRRFHATSITGEDAAIVLVLKLPPGDVDPDRLARLPQIDAFEAPVRPAEPPAAPAVDEAWRIDLEGVDAHVRQIALGEYRLDTPDGHLQGSLHATAGHLFLAPDVRVRVDQGELAVGSHEQVADGIRSDVRLRIDPFDPFAVKDEELLQRLWTETEVDGTLRSLEFLADRLPRAVVIGGGEGPLAIRLDVAAGVPLPTTRIEYRTDALRAYVRKLVVGAEASALVTVAHRQGRARIGTRIDLRRVHGGQAGTAHANDGFVAREMSLEVTYGEPEIATNEWPLQDLAIEIPKLVVEDVGALGDATGDLQPIGGRLELSWSTSERKDGAFGHAASLELRGLAQRVRGVTVLTSGRIELNARTDRQLRRTSITKLSAELDDLELDSDNGHCKNGCIRITRANAQLDHATGRVDARVRGRMDDLRPVLAHLDRRKRLAERVPDYDLTAPVEFDVELRRTARALDLEIHELSRPTLHVAGRLRFVGKRSRHAIVFRTARIGLTGEAGGDGDIELAIDDDWLQRKTTWVEALR